MPRQIKLTGAEGTQSRAVRTANRSGDHGIGLFGVDLKVFHGLLDYSRLDLLLPRQLTEHRQGNEPRIYFKEVTQRASTVAPAEAVRAQGNDRVRAPA